MTLTHVLLGLGIITLLFAVYLIFLSRHKKSGTGTLNLIGLIGIVHNELAPEGAVIVNGELWRARSANNKLMRPPQAIRVVEVQGHYLMVEAVSDSHSEA